MFWKTLRDRITDELLARRVDRWITGAIALLLVLVGFLTGRWTTFTSTATPIVFQEAPTAGSGEQGVGSSEATPEDLRALVVEKKDPIPNSQLSTAKSAFVASANGTKYYVPDCAEVRRIKEENKIWFDSEEEAKESGYEASECVKRRGR